MSAKDVPPSITLPTSDYHTIVKMSNHAVVGVFRQHVFARRSTRRYAPPSLKNTTPIALKELRSVSWSKSFMTATKFTVAFLCRLPIIDGRTTMKAPFFSPAFCLITSLITACSSPSGPNAWTPVTSGPPRAPIPQNEVLVIDEYPMGEYTNVGHFNGPEGRIVHVSMEDKELIDYFTREAAAMGGNTVVIREPRIRYRSGEGKSSRVDVIYVREEMGTHGAEDLGMDSLPIDEESLRIY